VIDFTIRLFTEQLLLFMAMGTPPMYSLAPICLGDASAISDSPGGCGDVTTPGVARPDGLKLGGWFVGVEPVVTSGLFTGIDSRVPISVTNDNGGKQICPISSHFDL